MSAFTRVVPLIACVAVSAIFVEGCSHQGDASTSFPFASIAATATPVTVAPLTTIIAPVTSGATARFLYTSDDVNAALSQFSIDPATGALSFVGFSAPVGATPPGSPDTGVFIMCGDEQGKFLYAINSYSSSVTGFSIDPTTGKLTKFDEWNLGARQPVGGYMSPDGKWLVLHTQPNAQNQGEGWLTSCSVDAKGEITPVFDLPFDGTTDPVHCVFDRSGTMLYGVGSRDPSGVGANNVTTIAIDTAGNLTIAATVQSAGPGWSLVVDPNDAYVYVLGADASITPFTRDATGALTAGTPIAAQGGGYSIAISPTGATVYVTEQLQPAGGAPVDVLQAYAASGGALTALGAPVPCGPRPTRVRVDPSGTLAFTCDLGSDHISTFALDRTGAATADGTSSVCKPVGTPVIGPTAFWLVQ